MHPVLLSGTPILDVDATLLIYVVVFFVLFFVLRHFVFQPMMALFDEREAAIDGAKREARDLEKDAEAKLAAFEKEMAKVRKEVHVERDKMKADAATKERAILAEVRTETNALLAEADAKMAKEASRVRSEIDTQSPILARHIAEKLLGREVAS